MDVATIGVGVAAAGAAIGAELVTVLLFQHDLRCCLSPT